MTVYQSYLIDGVNESEPQAGFSQVLDIMIDPVVEMCVAASEKKRRLRPKWDQAVFMLNCLSYLLVSSIWTNAQFTIKFKHLWCQTVLEPFSFTVAKQEVIRSALDERIAALIDDHVCTPHIYLGGKHKLKWFFFFCLVRQHYERGGNLSSIPDLSKSYYRC